MMADLENIIWDVVSCRRAVRRGPVVRIIKNKNSKDARIAFHKTAGKVIAGHQSQVSIKLGLNPDNTELFIQVCSPEDEGARPLNMTTQANPGFKVGWIGRRLKMIAGDVYSGIVETENRDMFIVKLEQKPTPEEEDEQ